MILAQLTSRAAVESAIEECDHLGRDEFLRTYGFGPARNYVLEYKGKQYDSKAIAGVAYGYQYPKLGPLTAAMFSGGVSRNAAASCLREMGFQINVLGQ